MDSPLIIPQCRICYESSNPNQLFSPCKCSGTSQYVHRECLYDWIRLSENIEAKNKCMECGYKYKKTNNRCNQILLKISNYIITNNGIILLLLLSVNILNGYILYNINNNLYPYKKYSNEDDDNHTILNTKIHPYLSYLFFGTCITSIYLLISGLLFTYIFYQTYMHRLYLSSMCVKSSRYSLYLFLLISAYILHFLIITVIVSLFAKLEILIQHSLFIIEYVSVTDINILPYKNDIQVIEKSDSDVQEL